MTRFSRAIFTALLVVALGALAFLTLRQKNSSPPEDRARGGTLRALLRDEPRTFNRYLRSALNVEEMLAQVMHERLIRVNRATIDSSRGSPRSGPPKRTG